MEQIPNHREESNPYKSLSLDQIKSMFEDLEERRVNSIQTGKIAEAKALAAEGRDLLLEIKTRDGQLIQ